MEHLNVKMPLFEDPPDDLTEDHSYGFLIGGMAAHTNTLAIGKAYRLAAENLTEAAIKSGEGHEICYPVLFLYRQTVELYLKAATHSGKEVNHDIGKLILKLEGIVGVRFKGGLPVWAKQRLLEFHEIDPSSMNLRYVDAKASLTLVGEYWVNMHRLKNIMGILLDGLERVAYA